MNEFHDQPDDATLPVDADEPADPLERLHAFRQSHPVRQLETAGATWEYISAGRGAETLLLLPGGMRFAESAMPYFQMFEASYRVLAPSYAPVATMDEVTDGVVAILDAEGVGSAYALGQSYGGLVAQVFLRRFPARLRKLVLSGAAPLEPFSGRQRAQLRTGRLLGMLPEGFLLSTYKRALFQAISFPEAEFEFWDAYFDELFAEHMTRAHFRSHFSTLADGARRYGYAAGETSSWPGQVLLIGADDDSTMTELDWERLRAIYPRAEVVLIAEGGPTPAMARPAAYAAAVRRFLDQAPPPG